MEQIKTYFNYALLMARRSFSRNEYDNTITHLNNAINAINDLKHIENKWDTDKLVKSLFKDMEKSQQEEFLRRFEHEENIQ